MSADETIAALKAMESRVEAATVALVFKAALEVQKLAQENAPVKTGALRRSIFITGPSPIATGIWQAKIGPTVIYGRIRELGGHIYPRRVRFLRWFGEDGRPIFARHVYQFGRPYLKPATDVVKSRYDELAAQAWGEAMSE